MTGHRHLPPGPTNLRLREEGRGGRTVDMFRAPPSLLGLAEGPLRGSRLECVRRGLGFAPQTSWRKEFGRMASSSIRIGLPSIAALPTRCGSSQLPAGRGSIGSLARSPLVRIGSRPASLRGTSRRGPQKFNPLCLGEERNGEGSRRFRVGAASAAPVAVDPLSSAEGRAILADEYGFTQIGEPVPEGVTLKNVIDSLPPEVFEINPWKAWKSVAITVAAYALGIFWIAVSPWYLLPFAWAWTGTAATGFFVIGHDCAHKSFSKNKLVEDVVGTLAFLPLIYPYEPWRFKHDRHHAKTNMLVEDTAWHPIVRDEWEAFPGWIKKVLEVGVGPLRPWASIGHWYLWHFNLKKFRASEQKRVKISLAAVFAFVAIGWPAIIHFTGIAGWLKFWLMPWLGYHFWMSTFTMVHHTAPHIPFKDEKEWNPAAAQLGGTVHCDYPSWIEILCHDINVHIPHHISQKIPSYNLRLATDSMRQNWGKYMNEASWNWRLMKTIMTQCHMYDEEKNYVPLDEGVDESKVLGPLRKLMPEAM